MGRNRGICAANGPEPGGRLAKFCELVATEERDYSHRTAVQKLGVKPEQRVEVIGDVGPGLRRDVQEAIGRGLVRSGVGNLTLVDFDDVCVTNMNRQLHAVVRSVGRSKADLMAQRCKDINPEVNVVAVKEFYREDLAAKVREDFVALRRVLQSLA